MANIYVRRYRKKTWETLTEDEFLADLSEKTTRATGFLSFLKHREVLRFHGDLYTTEKGRAGLALKRKMDKTLNVINAIAAVELGE